MSQPTVNDWIKQRGEQMKQIKKCGKCGGKSFMNGFCLTCEHKQANAAAKQARDMSINDHIDASLRQGFKK